MCFKGVLFWFNLTTKVAGGHALSSPGKSPAPGPYWQACSWKDQNKRSFNFNKNIEKIQAIFLTKMFSFESENFVQSLRRTRNILPNINIKSQVTQVVFFPSLMYLLFYRYIKFKTVVNFVLRCLDTVFQGPYRYFSIALKVVFSLSDRYKIFTSNWLWIEICENVVLSKIDITMTTINKKLWNW